MACVSVSAPGIDRILVEASPGEVRAIAFSGDTPWDIAIERPAAGPVAGDIFRARAGAEGPAGGRFFDLGGGVSALSRRTKRPWTNGAYGLVQILRGEAGDKGPRVTDRVEVQEGGIAVAIGSGGSPDDRIEVSRHIGKGLREDVRSRLLPILPKDLAFRIEALPANTVVDAISPLIKRLRDYQAESGGARRLFSASGEVCQLLERWTMASVCPADPATGAWLGSLQSGKGSVEPANPTVAPEIDAVFADGLELSIEVAGGAVLWIEQTRALVAADVDRAGALAASTEINIAAGQELARHLRLRRLGGIIAVDFLREGQGEGIAALGAFSAGDPWPWSPPHGPDGSGLVSFQRARSGQDLRALTTGTMALALAGLRRATRLARGGRLPQKLRARPEVIDVLRTDLAEALADAESRLGNALDLERRVGLPSVQVIGRNDEVLDAV